MNSEPPPKFYEPPCAMISALNPAYAEWLEAQRAELLAEVEKLAGVASEAFDDYQENHHHVLPQHWVDALNAATGGDRPADSLEQS